jgi:replicative DNA helicase
VSGDLKTLAVKFDVPFLVLSSLSRPPKASPNWRPDMASLRESGELEHDCDALLLLHREEGQTVTEVHLAKNRDGTTGHLTLNFHGPTVSFTEVT